MEGETEGSNSIQLEVMGPAIVTLRLLVVLWDAKVARRRKLSMTQRTADALERSNDGVRRQRGKNGS